MIKPELLEDALKCAKILYLEEEWYVTEHGNIKARVLPDTFFDPYIKSTDFELLAKAVFEHKRLNYDCLIAINKGTYTLEIDKLVDGEFILDRLEDGNLTDFLIQALPVLEGK